jgi:hypothetical protein
MEKNKNSDAVRKQLEKAQALIKAKKFNDARAILITLDHPTADKWLARLNEISANAPQTVVVQESKKSGGCLRNTLALIGLFVVCSVVFAMANPNGMPSSDPNAAGTRGNPFPAGSAQEVRDGTFRVNSIRTDMSEEVNTMNMFNVPPETGQEWVLVNVTFNCNLPADEVCTTQLMQFELVGTTGRAYNHQMLAVLDNPFAGEVFGGGTATGDIGFIVDSSDTDLLLVLVDIGRKFFAIP